jgi:hypothetical protein
MRFTVIGQIFNHKGRKWVEGKAATDSARLLYVLSE